MLNSVHLEKMKGLEAKERRSGLHQGSASSSALAQIPASRAGQAPFELVRLGNDSRVFAPSGLRREIGQEYTPPGTPTPMPGKLASSLFASAAQDQNTPVNGSANIGRCQAALNSISALIAGIPSGMPVPRVPQGPEPGSLTIAGSKRPAEDGPEDAHGVAKRVHLAGNSADERELRTGGADSEDNELWGFYNRLKARNQAAEEATKVEAARRRQAEERSNKAEERAKEAEERAKAAEAENAKLKEEIAARAASHEKLQETAKKQLTTSANNLQKVIWERDQARSDASQHAQIASALQRRIVELETEVHQSRAAMLDFNRERRERLADVNKITNDLEVANAEITRRKTDLETRNREVEALKARVKQMDRQLGEVERQAADRFEDEARRFMAQSVELRANAEKRNGGSSAPKKH